MYTETFWKDQIMFNCFLLHMKGDKIILIDYQTKICTPGN